MWWGCSTASHGWGAAKVLTSDLVALHATNAECLVPTQQQHTVVNTSTSHMQLLHRCMHLLRCCALILSKSCTGL